MRDRPLLAVPILCIAAAMLLAACGGDGDDGGSDDEAQVTEAIETSVKSTDPADCTTLQTQKFTEQVQFQTGEAAVKSCEEEATDTSDDPDSVEVSNVSIDGEAATADVAFTGSAFDGSTVSLALVKEGDQWKLDEITDIPTLDLEGFRAAFIEQLEADGETPQQVKDCITESFASITEEQVRSALISGDPSQLTGLFAECVPGA
jgi:hypothetical protein